MTIREAVLAAETLNDAAVIYAFQKDSGWQPNTLCLMIEGEEQTVIHRNGRRLDYFLEIHLVLEVIEGWQEIGKGMEVSEEDLVRVVIYYARHDCWPQPTQAR